MNRYFIARSADEASVREREQQTADRSASSYYALFWLFLFGSVLGYLLEGIWHFLRKGYWESHTATVWGPFCIIYGFGAVAMYLMSLLVKKNRLWVQFAAFAVIGTAVEAVGGLLQEVCFGTFSWNYEGHFLNIAGRISLGMTLLWGMLGVAFLYLLKPAFDRLMAHMRGKAWNISCILLSAFMAVNLAVTSVALSRWNERNKGEPANNAVEVYMDKHYGDDTMRRLFPNMQFLE